MKARYEVKSLNELCFQITDGVHHTPKYQETGVPFLSVKNLSKGILDFSDTKFVTREDHEKMKRRCDPQLDDVLYTKVGTTGIAKVIDTEREFSLFVSVALLKPKHDEVFNRYLEYFLNSDLGREQARKRTRGAANKNLVIRDIREIKVVVPPLHEQQRIVAVLDEAFEVLARAKENAEVNLQSARELLAEMISRRFSAIAATGGSVKALGEVADFRNGLNFTRTSSGTKVKVVGVGDFKDNFEVPLNDLSSVTVDGDLSEADCLQAGDLLAVRSNGNRELIGRTMVLPELEEPVSFSGFTIRIRLKTEELSPAYLCEFMKTREARAKLTAGGGGANISNLNQRLLAGFSVHYPDRPEQRRVLDELGSLRSYAQRLVDRYQDQLDDLDDLRQSLLQKAFAGELT